MSVLVDANVLIYAKFSDFPQHKACRAWLDGALNDPEPVGIPWVTQIAFVRITTNRRVFEQPLSPEQALEQTGEWNQRPNVWQPEPSDRFAALFEETVRARQASGNLVTDAYLAALAREHGLTVVSTDSDFTGFGHVKCLNPTVD